MRDDVLDLRCQRAEVAGAGEGTQVCRELWFEISPPRRGGAEPPRPRAVQLAMATLWSGEGCSCDLLAASLAAAGGWVHRDGIWVGHPEHTLNIAVGLCPRKEKKL